jgi:hypothetical protein
MKGIQIGLNAFKIVLAVIGLVVCTMLIVNWDPAYADMMTMPEIFTSLPSIMNPLNTGVVVSYIAIAICVIAWLVFGGVKVAQNPKGSMRMLISTALVIVIAFIAYEVADSTVNPQWTYPADEKTSQLVSGGLILTAVLGVVAIASVIFLEVSKSFK